MQGGDGVVGMYVVSFLMQVLCSDFIINEVERIYVHKLQCYDCKGKYTISLMVKNMIQNSTICSEIKGINTLQIQIIVSLVKQW